MSMTTTCKDCRGRNSCTMPCCLFPENDSYITTQAETREKETKRRKELKGNYDGIHNK